MVNQNAQTRLNKVEEIVLKAIDELRPYLHNDGGDMELVEITDDNRVIVKPVSYTHLTLPTTD